MKKCVVVFSALSVWSMDNKIGAPSFYETLKGYSENDWETILITPNLICDVFLKNIEVINVGLINKNSYKSKYLQFLSNVKYTYELSKAFLKAGEKIVKKLLDENKNVIIYAYEVHSVLACKKIAAKYKCPLVTRFQGVIMSSKTDNLINRIGYFPHYQALKTVSDLVIMTNDGTSGELYLKNIGNNSHVLFLRNGVDIEAVSSDFNEENIRKSLLINDNDIILMTLSRLVKWKRVDRAIYALRNVLKYSPNCKLVIVGDGDERVNLENLAKKLNVFNNVVFAGGIPQKDVSRYLNIADIFLSLYDLSNLGNPLFEAMKCGKAIITLNTGDTSSVVVNGQNAIMLELENTDDIGKTIVSLLNNYELRNLLESQAKKFAEENFWNWKERMRYECEEVEKLLLK